MKLYVVYGACDWAPAECMTLDHSKAQTALADIVETDGAENCCIEIYDFNFDPTNMTPDEIYDRIDEESTKSDPMEPEYEEYTDGIYAIYQRNNNLNAE